MNAQCVGKRLVEHLIHNLKFICSYFQILMPIWIRMIMQGNCKSICKFNSFLICRFSVSLIGNQMNSRYKILIQMTVLIIIFQLLWLLLKVLFEGNFPRVVLSLCFVFTYLQEFTDKLIEDEELSESQKDAFKVIVCQVLQLRYCYYLYKSLPDDSSRLLGFCKGESQRGQES